jgi:hypothetical protein
MNATDLKARLVASQRTELSGLAQSLVLERTVPHFFAGNEAHFVEVRQHFAQGLDVDAGSVHLVGSGCVGYSIAPDTFPRAFHAGSDLDIAVVSEALFDRVWHTLINWGIPRRHTLGGEELTWFGDRKDEIFWGWIDPKRLKVKFRGLRYGADLRPLRDVKTAWFETFQGITNAFPGADIAGREVSGRLYRTKEHLVHYQAESLRRLKYRLTNPST